MNKRIDALAEQLAQNGLDWAVLNPGPSLRYLTGLNFHRAGEGNPAGVGAGKGG